MKCPLLLLSRGMITADEPTRFGDCLKEDCAWWDKDNSQCTLITWARGLEFLNIHAIEIRNKMPHVGQFLK